MPELTLEIGFEEMPAAWLPGLAAQLREAFEAAAAREHLSPRDTLTLWTPRRLVLRAEVASRQDDRAEPSWGPALRIARDASGAWTKAAHGFARKNGVEPDQLQVSAKDPAAPGELYLLHVAKTQGRDAAQVLPGVLAACLRGLAFPKRMSWDAWIDDGKGAFPFGRPIRWLVVLLDGAVVPFAIHHRQDGARGEVAVTASDRTRGHRFLPRGTPRDPVRVGSFADLVRRLKERSVLLDPTEREERIRTGLEQAAGGRVADTHGLVSEWRDLVEYPTVVSGRVPEEFRSLPVEVLETVLVHHQKYLPLPAGRSALRASGGTPKISVRASGGTPKIPVARASVVSAPGAIDRFAAVVDGDGANAAGIVKGMERVVVARLRDAAFFYSEDRKRPLVDRVADLSGVTFHQGLGTYRDKAGRMERLVDTLGPETGLLAEAEHRAAREAAELAKADLTTLMVREFPELQGVMGGLYLKDERGDASLVAGAVRHHYLPVSVEEDSPPQGAFPDDDAATRVFAAVSVSDKLDTLAGYFGLGLQPTGSSDPFGLRRGAQGVVRVLLDLWPAEAGSPRPSLRRLIAAAVDGYGPALKRPAAEVASELEAFVLDRLRHVLVARGYPSDEVEAALGALEPDALDDAHECRLRLEALHRVRAEARDDFEHLAVAFKRAKNILGESRHPPPDPALFETDAERELHQAVGRLQEVDGDYDSRLRSLAGLRGPVDRFFDDVLVMAEDPRVRANRLGLLSPALSLFYRIADISKLGGSR